MKRILFLITFSFNTVLFSQAVAVITSPQDSVCIGQAVTLSSSSSTDGGSPILNSIWNITGPNSYSFSGSSAPGSDLIVNNLNFSGTYTVSLINQHQNGTASASQEIDFISVFGYPSAQFGVQKMGASQDQFGNFQCPPVIANFTNTSNSSTPITSTWFLYSQNPNATSTETSPQGIQYLYPGTFDVTLIIEDMTGCTDTIEMHNFLTIGGPNADVSLNQTGNQNFMEYSFNISNLSNVGSVQWDLGNGEEILNDTDGFIYTYTTNGTFNPSVTISDNNGCQVSYNLGPITTGISNLDIITKNELVFYPNPTSGFIILKQTDFSEISIHDINGKQISKNLYPISNKQIDLRNLNPGIYFLNLDGLITKILKN